MQEDHETNVNDALEQECRNLGIDFVELGSVRTNRPHVSRASDSYMPWVLHVDDDAEFSEILKIKLHGRGLHVVRAFNGMDGLQATFNQPAEAIVLDSEMPGGSGEFMLRRLKANPVTRSIPVIFLSGTSDPELERRVIMQGAELFYRKPPNFDELADSILRLTNTAGLCAL